MAEVARRMRIPIVSGVGRGSTLLSAFDGALGACGVLNYNLIPLSSVIPPEATVVPLEHYEVPGDEHGHRLYVVKADMRSDDAGKHIGAGIGWYQWGDGRGVFVEHETIGATREVVAAELGHRVSHSLHDLCTARQVPFSEERLRSRVCIAEVEDRPLAVLVLALFQAEGWR